MKSLNFLLILTYECNNVRSEASLSPERGRGRRLHLGCISKCDSRTLWQVFNPRLLVFILTIYYHISLQNFSTIHLFNVHQCLICFITLQKLWSLPQNQNPSLVVSPHKHSCHSRHYLHLVISYIMTLHHQLLSSYNTFYLLWWNLLDSSLLSLPIN